MAGLKTTVETGDADPGPRFLAPAARPRHTGTDALSLLDEAGLEPRLDVPMALAFLVNGEYDAYRSFFHDVTLAPPRCPIRQHPDGTLAAERGAGPRARDLAPAEAASALRSAIDDAVRVRIAPHARVGVWLSGGVDSSVVAAAAAGVWRALDRDPNDLRCYHHRPAEGPGEAERARAVAAALGRELVEIRAAEGDPYAGTEALFARLDLPTDGGGPATSLALAGRMHDDGVGLLLTGDGGDEAFGRLRPATAADAIRRALPVPLPPAVRLALPRPGLPRWLARHAPRRHAIHTAPAPRRGLRGKVAVRDRMIRMARQVSIVAFVRAVAATAGLQAAFPLLDAKVTDLCVALPPARWTRGPRRALALAAYGPLQALGPPPEKGAQPAAEAPLGRALARYGPAWAARWLDGGLLEGMEVVPAGQGAAILAAAVRGSAEESYRGYRLLGLEIFARARLGLGT